VISDVDDNRLNRGTVNELVVTTAGTDPDLVDFDESPLLALDNLGNSLGVFGVPERGVNGVPVVGGPLLELLGAVGVTDIALRPVGGALLSDKLGLGVADCDPCLLPIAAVLISQSIRLRYV